MKNKKLRVYKRLSLAEVQFIFVMRSESAGIRELARKLGRAPSTVSKTLSKYRHPKALVWLAMTALEQAIWVHEELRGVIVNVVATMDVSRRLKYENTCLVSFVMSTGALSR